MAEIFKKPATELRGKTVFADADVTSEEVLAKKFNMDGFPILKFSTDGNEVVDHNDGRGKESMIQFIERATVLVFYEIDSGDA